MAGLVFARHMVPIEAIIAFSAVIQALAAYYRQPFLVLWRTVAFSGGGPGDRLLKRDRDSEFSPLSRSGSRPGPGA